MSALTAKPIHSAGRCSRCMIAESGCRSSNANIFSIRFSPADKRDADWVLAFANAGGSSSNTMVESTVSRRQKTARPSESPGLRPAELPDCVKRAGQARAETYECRARSRRSHSPHRPCAGGSLAFALLCCRSIIQVMQISRIALATGLRGSERNRTLAQIIHGTHTKPTRKRGCRDGLASLARRVSMRQSVSSSGRP